MLQNFSYKDFFKKYGFFVAIIVVVFGILIYTTKLSHKFWQSSLKTGIENVLEEAYPYEWVVGNSVPLENNLAANAACCEVRNRTSGRVYYAIMIRIGTFYGPLPAVFLYDNNESNPKVSFVGYSSLHGRIAEIEKSKSVDKRIDYWQKKIPEIIGK